MIKEGKIPGTAGRKHNASAGTVSPAGISFGHSVSGFREPGSYGSGTTIKPMAKRKKKKKKALPKPRHVWEINPKSRVKDSDKKYNRTRQRKKKSWTDELDWFE